jgi:hypothetical protein
MTFDHRSAPTPVETFDADVVECGPAGPWRGRTVATGDVGRPTVESAPYLGVAPGVRLASVGGEVIALDLRADRYFAFGPAASAAMHAIAITPGPLSMQPSLVAAVRRGLLVPLESPPGPVLIPQPVEPGGVLSRSRLAYALAENPALGSRGLLRAAQLIVSYDRMLCARGLAVLIARLQAAATVARPPLPEVAAAERLASLATVHERARRLVGRPRRSAAAAAALASHAWRCGVPARVVLGVQKYPFHDHMWVECHGVVAGAAADVGRKLAHILTVEAGTTPAVPA